MGAMAILEYYATSNLIINKMAVKRYGNLNNVTGTTTESYHYSSKS